MNVFAKDFVPADFQVCIPVFTNDMTLSAKDIARNFLLFGSEIPLEQLSGDNVTNFLNRTIPFDWLCILQ